MVRLGKCVEKLNMSQTDCRNVCMLIHANANANAALVTEDIIIIYISTLSKTQYSMCTR